MFDFLKRKPHPDFEEFKSVIQGKKIPKKVHQVELLIDREIMVYISQNYLNEQPVPFAPENKRAFFKWYTNWWYRLGYDYVGIIDDPNITGLSFLSKKRITTDTAQLSKEKREWIEEGKGIIQSWEDFESYPWPEIEQIDFSFLDLLAECIPEGMKVFLTPSSGVFEVASEELLGFEGMSYLLYEDYPLVKAVFDKVGETLYAYYSAIVAHEVIGGFFQGDDLGYKTSTIVAPIIIRELVIPWHKKCASLAHEHGKVFFFHSCGNIFAVMDDLIEEVKIDAYHSFQDEIMPIWEFKKLFGDRVGYLGGVDLNKLCLNSEGELRKYVREIIEKCFPGRFAIGSGNSIANYVPPENYLIMLDEANKWN
ncbi:MAG: hypothetical protein J7J32_04540 [Candidatus Atribacteria bacterium]|nr:hypothetical protein [Candidatus Atribacteria bacterium]MCD6350182.1 hypothetical protein [Candidatus Atribacteria bacterium]